MINPRTCGSAREIHAASMIFHASFQVFIEGKMVSQYGQSLHVKRMRCSDIHYDVYEPSINKSPVQDFSSSLGFFSHSSGVFPYYEEHPMEEGFIIYPVSPALVNNIPSDISLQRKRKNNFTEHAEEHVENKRKRRNRRPKIKKGRPKVRENSGENLCLDLYRNQMIPMCVPASGGNDDYSINDLDSLTEGSTLWESCEKIYYYDKDKICHNCYNAVCKKKKKSKIRNRRRIEIF